MKERPGEIISLIARPLKTFLKRLDMDRAIFYAVLTRAWVTVCGPVTLFLIATRFSPQVQGYFYTFRDILSMQFLVEMGLSIVVVQFASHEWSKLSLGGDGRIEGDPRARSRLASLARFAVRWYAVAGMVLTLCLVVAGSVFFSKSQGTGVDWKGPWLILCLLNGVNLVVNPLFWLLIGCNQVARVNAGKLLQAVLNNTFIFTAILLGAGLWTGAVSSAVCLFWAAGFLLLKYGGFMKSLFSVPRQGPQIEWSSEVLPMQWRIAISHLFGFMVTFLFTPVLFHFHGPVLAGQMGMTWAIINALSEVSYNWITARVPQFGMLIAKRDFAALDRLFSRSNRFSLLILASGSCLVLGGVWLLNQIGHHLASRILPVLPTALLLLGTLSSNYVGNMAFYLRAHKKEPYMVTSIIGGLLMGTMTLVFGRSHGALGIGAAYVVLAVLLFVPNTLIFLRCRERWHREEA